MVTEFKNVGERLPVKNYHPASLHSVVSKVFETLSDRIAGAFNGYRFTRAVALDTSKTFNRVWHLVFFTSLRLTEFWVRYLFLFPLFSVIEDFGWFWMVSIAFCSDFNMTRGDLCSVNTCPS